MLYNYLLKNYEKGEPVFLSELPGKSKDYIRQEMKKLTDEGKIERLYNGVYFLSYTTILGTKGKVSVDRFLEKKFLNVNEETTGYISGIQLANMYGFTTQNPSCIEICSNAATTMQRKITIDGRQIIVYKPLTTVTKENCSALQFLDMMSYIDKYSELTGELFKKQSREFAKLLNVNFNLVKEYISLFPDKVYRNIYYGGLMNELV